MNQKKRWLVNAALFTGLVVCFFVDLTGVSLHQWLGMIGGALAGYHLIAHWGWVRAVAGRFFGRTSSQARLYLLLDALIGAGFLAMIGTGLLISTWLNLALAGYETWRALHVLFSIGTLLAVTLKIGLHARMIIAAARRLVGARPAPVPPAAERRAFFKLMGVVGAASLVALTSSLTALAGAEDAEVSSAGSSSAHTSRSSRSSLGSSSSTCVVRCGRRCAYPGHCRRYVDSNNSGRCDLGECQG